MSTLVSVLARAPITCEVAGGGTTHAPMVMASVGGAAPARFVLDTGSDVHLLNEDLANELELPKEAGEEGTDHSGATMPSWNVGNVDMVVSGVSLVLRNVVAIPAPPPFPGHGIRGILSPQHLHPTAWIVLDMAMDELLVVEGNVEDVATFLRDRSASMELLTLPRDAVHAAIVVPAAIEGFPEIPTLIDTGGKRTEFSTTAVPGLVGGATQRLGGGVSGADVHGAVVGPQTLAVGGRRLSVPALGVRQQMHDPQGLVGMDVLRGTVVACAADVSRPVLWLVPASP